ncbi:unnamed protein product [Phytomonas sp. Hart1]|nr:unnamed protein product [Phytomonas sp. Hart1]|eukprot:CCW69275.1 unnamed protein product [Phytomonas sp. isolate Hart1]
MVAVMNCSHGFPFERVFLINLTRRRDRLEFMRAQLFTRAGLAPHAARIERVAAINGEDLRHSSDANPFERLFRAGFLSKLGLCRLRQTSSARKVWGMDLNPAAVGCALSHIELWARIIALSSSFSTSSSSPPRFLVLEDDSLLPEAFLERYHARIAQIPAGEQNNWELLYLSGLDAASDAVKQKLIIAPGISRVSQLHRTTNAYVVTPSGAKKLLERGLPLTFQIDTMITMNVERDSNPDYREDGGNGNNNNDHHIHGESARPLYVQEPRCLSLQPPLIVQATQLGSDIQPSPPPLRLDLREDEKDKT